jgi:hypothetical protein
MLDDDIFIKLVEAVENEGGELLVETHHPDPHYYETPNGADVSIEGCGCGQDSLLRVAYDDHQPDRKGVEPSGGDVIARHIKVCAIDDRMDLWPRYAKKVYG